MRRRVGLLCACLLAIGLGGLATDGRAQAIAWSEALTTRASATSRASAACADGRGGWIFGGLDGTQVVVASLDDGGAIRWQTRLFATTWTVHGVSPLADGGVLAVGDVLSGGRPAKPWLARFAADGSLAWARSYLLGRAASGWRAFELSDGSLRLVASHENLTSEGLLLALDRDGAVFWAKAYSGNAWILTGFTAAALLPGDVIAVGGAGYASSGSGPCIGTIDSAGTVLQADCFGWTWRWDPFDLGISDLAVALDGTIGATGSGGSEDLGTGAWDPFLVRMRSDGSAADVKTFQSNDRAWSGGLAPTPDGGWILGGWTFRETPDIIDSAVAWKLDASGSIAWQSARDEASHDAFDAAATAGDGGALLVGRHEPLRSQRPEASLMRCDAAGDAGTSCLANGPSRFSVVTPAWTLATPTFAVATLAVTVVVESSLSTQGTLLARGFGDAFEPDDTIDPLGTPVPDPFSAPHDFCDDDLDMYVLAACAGESIVLSVEALGTRAAPLVELLAGDAVTVVGSGDVARPLAWTAPAGGPWYVRVSNRGVVGSETSYRLLLDRVAPGCPTWAATYMEQLGNCRGICASPDGTFVVVGDADESVTGTWDTLVMKVDGTGAVIWKTVLHEPNWTFGARVDVCPDTSILLTVADYSFGTIAKLAPDGQTIAWQRRMTQSIEARWLGVRTMPDGGALACGGVRTSPGDSFVVARLNALGGISWERKYQDGYSAFAMDLTLTSDGGCIASGWLNAMTGERRSFVASLAADGTERWQRQVVGTDVVSALSATGDDGLIAVTTTGIVRLDSTGDLVWSRDIVGFNAFDGIDIVAMPDGGFVLAGRQNLVTQYVFEIMGLDANGDILWQHAIGRPGTIGSAWAAIPMPDGGVMASGILDDQAGIVRLDRDGQIVGSCAVVSESDYVSLPAALSSIALGVVPTASFLPSGPGLLVPFAAEPTRADTCAGGSASLPLEVSPPASIQPLLFTGPTQLTWEDGATSGSSTFDLYQGLVTDLRAAHFGDCLQSAVPTNAAVVATDPPLGTCWFYLVAGRNVSGQGPLGNTSRGQTRAPATRCP